MCILSEIVHSIGESMIWDFVVDFLPTILSQQDFRGFSIPVSSVHFTFHIFLFNGFPLIIEMLTTGEGNVELG